jgi:TatD DNase family protein
MLDSHCHLDRYRDPLAIAREAESRDTFVIAVTNLPSHFATGLPHARSFRRVRLALGLHPLAVADHEQEIPRFTELLSQTSFVGEVGLDFSREGESTKDQQLRSFRLVAEHVSRTPKIVSLHSRGAESTVLAILQEYRIRTAIFHWYSGTLSTLKAAVAAGHYFSINPAMIVSAKGQDIIRRIPREQMLTETDGPHVLIEKAPARPWDVAPVEAYLATVWSVTAAEAQKQIWANFQRLVRNLAPGPGVP